MTIINKIKSFFDKMPKKNIEDKEEFPNYIAHICNGVLIPGDAFNCGLCEGLDDYTVEDLCKYLNEYFDADKEKEEAVKPKIEPLTCLICQKELMPIDPLDGWEYMQPSGGGEVNFIFAYGSIHDGSVYKGVICDDCAESCIKKMQQERYIS